MSENTVILNAEGLTYRMGKRYLLDNITWQVKKGEAWVLFGLNGSGKTTLLRTIAGFGNPTSGKLEVFGESYTGENLLALRRRIGFISSSFFDRYYFKELAFHIVLSGLTGCLGLSNKLENTAIIKAKTLLKQLHMENCMMQPFYELSKGERQKILIARALIAEPELLILDEPSTGLDVYAREQMLEFVRRLVKREISLIYVTHYTEEILDIFTHCILLKQGSIYQQGKTKNLFTEGNLSTFLECPVTLQQEFGKYYIALNTKEGYMHE